MLRATKTNLANACKEVSVIDISGDLWNNDIEVHKVGGPI
jgi:hypothetical protein